MEQVTINHIYRLPYLKTLDCFGKQYAKDNGINKTEDIGVYVQSSKKVRGLLNKTGVMPPYYKDILAILHTIGYFLFSKSETICLGAIVVLDMWIRENDVDPDSPDEVFAKDTLIELLEACENMKGKKGHTFFTNFWNIINIEFDIYEQIVTTEALRLSQLNFGDDNEDEEESYLPEYIDFNVELEDTEKGNKVDKDEILESKNIKRDQNPYLNDSDFSPDLPF